MSVIDSVEQLEAIYGHPGETATAKVTRHITPDYRALINASPFLALATCGPEGLDCSPRGDLPGFVRIVDKKTLYIPDRRGNNRIDSLRNIVRDPRVALLFFLPGLGNLMRVNAQGHITIDEDIVQSFAIDGKTPRSVIVARVDEVYFQCARAIVRSELWNPSRFLEPDTLPTAGEILANITENRVGGESYDREWPERASKTLW